MTTFLYGGLALVSLIVLLLVVLRLRSGRARLIAVAFYGLVLVSVVAAAALTPPAEAEPERQYGREIERAVADLGERYILFRSLGPPDSTAFNDADCERGPTQADHRFLQRTWQVDQPVDFPTLEAALARDGFATGPASNNGAAAYGFLANRGDLAIQVQAIETGTEVRFSYGPCVPRPTIELAAADMRLATGGLYLP